MIEQMIIGTLLANPRLISGTGLRPDHFEDMRCASAYSIMVNLVSCGSEPDAYSVSEKMSGGVNQNLEELIAWIKGTIGGEKAISGWSQRLKQSAKGREEIGRAHV